MEGVNNSSATSDHQNDHGEEGEFHGLEDEKLDDAENDEDAEVNGSSELEEVVVAGPRRSITQS